jgi:hypothetical protein
MEQRVARGRSWTVETLVEELRSRGLKVERRGRSWWSQCPCLEHDDRHPSLQIKPGRSVPVVVKCQSSPACSQTAVWRAIGPPSGWTSQPQSLQLPRVSGCLCAVHWVAYDTYVQRRGWTLDESEDSARRFFHQLIRSRVRVVETASSSTKRCSTTLARGPASPGRSRWWLSRPRRWRGSPPCAISGTPRSSAAGTRTASRCARARRTRPPARDPARCRGGAATGPAARPTAGPAAGAKSAACSAFERQALVIVSATPSARAAASMRSKARATSGRICSPWPPFLRPHPLGPLAALGRGPWLPDGPRLLSGSEPGIRGPGSRALPAPRSPGGPCCGEGERAISARTTVRLAWKSRRARWPGRPLPSGDCDSAARQSAVIGAAHMHGMHERRFDQPSRGARLAFTRGPG